MATAAPFPKNLVRALLATTSLSAISTGIAHANSITLTPSTVGHTFPTTTSLAPGINQVFGSLTSGLDEDWFEFTNLAAGGAFSLSAQNNPLGQESGFDISLFTSGGASLEVGGINVFNNIGDVGEGAGTVLTGFVPGDGKLIAEMFNHGGAGSYVADLTATESSTPEPATTTTLGLGLALAGGLAWRRRRAR